MVYMYLIFTQNFIHTQMLSKLGLNRLINFLTNFLVSPKESEEVRRKQKNTSNAPQGLFSSDPSPHWS